MSAELDRDQLANILGMLGNAHDGEVVVAGRLAHKMVKEAGATWFDVVTPTITVTPQLAWPEPPQPWDSAEDCKEAVEALLLLPQHLSPWERGFLFSLQRRNRHLTDKQYRCLEKIGTRVDRAIRAAWEAAI